MNDSYEFVALTLVWITFFWVYSRNHRNYVATGKPSKPGEYSYENSYTNVSPFKHDIFKSLSLTVTPYIFAAVVFGQPVPPFISAKSFENTLVGKIVINMSAYFIFYHLLQPYVANLLPNF